MDVTSGEPIDGATTLVEAIRFLDGRGYGEQLIALTDGTLRCGGCGGLVDAAGFDVDGFYRLEGDSDPDDMNLVVWGRCAGCGTGGVATIGYGPNAGEADEAVLAGLELGDIAERGSLDADQVDRPVD